MTATAATTGGNDTSVTAYEELRTHVLTGTTAGCPSGLVVLLRHGVATWMARRSSCSAAASTASSTPTATPLVGDDIHAAIVRVLASMVLAGQREVRA